MIPCSRTGNYKLYVFGSFHFNRFMYCRYDPDTLDLKYISLDLDADGWISNTRTRDITQTVYKDVITRHDKAQVKFRWDSPVVAKYHLGVAWVFFTGDDGPKCVSAKVDDEGKFRAWKMLPVEGIDILRPKLGKSTFVNVPRQYIESWKRRSQS